MSNRRQLLQLGGTAAIAAIASPFASPTRSFAEDTAAAKPWLRKSLKIGMIRVPGSMTDKFNAAKRAGFEGVELNAPGFDNEEAVEAANASGLIIDGTVNADHWKVRHSDPDPDVRAQALKSLRDGLEATAKVGADTLLLVPAHGNDGSFEEVYERSMANIRRALPDAERLGVKILIENVWNHFLYDHGGGPDQSAEPLARYIDAFESPWVGVQFDIGNHWKYGDPAGWIRTLGERIKKLDIKGFSRKDDSFTKITEGDLPWGSVHEALREIGFTGWVAAEVGGGGQERLAEISQHMETALHCGESVS